MAKVKTLEELKSLIQKHQEQGKIVVFANGCFDLLHVGHVRYLKAARALGDLLVLGLNADESVAALKGKGRPIMNEQERLELVSAFECVDYVVLFNELTADRILGELKPDIHAKGTDYTEASVPERETVRSYGGRVAIVGDPKEHSSREYIDQLSRGEQRNQPEDPQE